jgi:hypothetical protein
MGLGIKLQVLQGYHSLVHRAHGTECYSVSYII